MKKGKRGAKAKTYDKNAENQPLNIIEESTKAYASRSPVTRFTIKRRGRSIRYETGKGYGYFINRLKQLNNALSLREVLTEGLSWADVEPVLEFLDLSQAKVAEAAAVSESTVSRWKDDSNIGRPGSEVFFKIDELIREGIELFGSEEAFYEWVHQPNLALGNKKPVDLITDQVGISMVEEAIDALHFGTLL